MTIDQQVRDRFDRLTDGSIPEPDLAAAIARGRRRRRGRAASYVAGSLAVAAVAAFAVVVPRLGDDQTPEPVPMADQPVTDDGTFVPGTTIDTDLAAAVAAADPSLPPPTDVYPSDWTRTTPLPDADFANATEWQLVYDLSSRVELLVYVTKPIPGEGLPGCVPDHPCQQRDTAAGRLLTTDDEIGDPVREVWFHSMLTAADGRFVNVIEQVGGSDPAQAPGQRVLTDDQLEAIAQASGLDFPDPVEPPADPSAAP